MSQFLTFGATTLGSTRRRVAFILIGVLSAVTASMGLLFMAPLYWTSTRENSLTVDEAYLDFGTVWSTSNFVWTIPVENRTFMPIVVDALAVSCQCSRVHPKAFTIEPNSKIDVTLTIDLTIDRQKTMLFQSRPFALTIQPISEAGHSSPIWTLRGYAKDALKCAPDMLNLGDTRQGQLGPFDIEIESAQALRKIGLVLPPQLMKTTIHSENGDKSYRLTIILDSPAKYGRHEHTLELIPIPKSASDENATPLPRQQFRIRHTVVPDLSVEPQMMALPTEACAG